MDNERTTTETRTTLPKKAFDSEYMTEFLREVRFLTEKGIQYTFVKKTQDYGISQYKYRKTPALFAALVEFYSMIEAERVVRRRRKEEEKKQETPEISAEELKKAQEILEKAVQQNLIKTENTQETTEQDDTI